MIVVVTSQLSGTHALKPACLLPDCRQVLVAIRCNEDDVFDAHAANAFIALQHVVIDVSRVAYRRKEMLVEVNPGFNGLYCGEARVRFTYLNRQFCQTEEVLTTTMRSSNGSRSLKYV